MPTSSRVDVLLFVSGDGPSSARSTVWTPELDALGQEQDLPRRLAVRDNERRNGGGALPRLMCRVVLP